MPDGVFKCGNQKCTETIAISGLNDVQLEVLRRWAKTCPRCHQRTKWQETKPFLDKQKQPIIGGSKNVQQSKISATKAGIRKKPKTRKA